MKNHNKLVIIIGLMAFSPKNVYTQTIEEKLAFEEARSIEPSSTASGFNEKLSSLKHALFDKYASVNDLIAQNADEEAFFELKESIVSLRADIAALENIWKKERSEEIASESDPFELFSQGECTLSELLMEYGGSEHIYVIPQELSQTKITISTMLPIPHSSLSDLVEIICKHNGIGIKELNPYTKQLFAVKQNFISVSTVTNKKHELDLLDPSTRIIFLYEPLAENLKPAFYFVERMRDPKTMCVYQVGSRIAMVGTAQDVKTLTQMCENVWEREDSKSTEVVHLSKLRPEEAKSLLKSFFGNLSESSRSMMSMKGGPDLSVQPLANEPGIILIGSKSMIARAKDILQRTENQLEEQNEMTIFWYTCSHCNAEELAQTLDKVYTSLCYYSLDNQEGKKKNDEMADASGHLTFPRTDLPHPSPDTNYGYAPAMNPWQFLQMQSQTRQQENKEKEKKKPECFIADPSTGSVMMVVRKDTLLKLKEVIKKLDVPKRMVEIEVLLCERLLTENTQSGINLLKIGTTAAGKRQGAIDFDTSSNANPQGLFQFLFSRGKSSAFPAFDFVYNFLLSQDDIHVRASPSITTINQKPANISITDQISINNGAAPVDSNAGIIFKESYDRADFGITINVTPTIHEPELDDPFEEIYVTLENEISFQNIKSNNNDRPDVLQREISNQVRIADGQCVILGGLRAHSVDNQNEKIPFLGELPGIGKLFGSTQVTEKNNEMFIFIRPKVVKDPKIDLIRFREAKLRARSGENEVFLAKLKQSQERQKKRTFERSFSLIFGNGDNLGY